MKKSKILIADDDIRFTQLASCALEAAGLYEILIVTESARLFFSARQFRPDLILLSFDLPGKPIGEIDRELRQDVTLRDIPIILFTAMGSPPEGNSQPLRSGHRILLTKPVAPDLLLDYLNRALRSRDQSM